MLASLKDLVSKIPSRARRPSPSPSPGAVVESIEFHGLENVPEKQLRAEVKTREGKTIDVETLSSDLSRLYATLLFDRVDFSLQQIGGNRYRLNYLVKEAPRNSLGASIRYDNDYKFVALAEITARQLFNTPSSATISSQFGGFEDHSAGLRYVHHALPSFFIEPKVHLRRRERLDMRAGEQVDTYTDRRVGGQLMLGWTMFKRLEVEAGYRTDRTTISGGTPPNALEDALYLAGLTLRLNRDTLDAHDYPRTGSSIRFQIDKRSRTLGSGVNYSKWSLDTRRFFSPARGYTVQLQAGGGYSRGDIPFYDRFWVGGFNFSEGSSRHLVGFQRDEFSARQVGYAAASVRRQIFSHPLSFAKRGFLTGYYNLAGISDRNSAPYDFTLYHGAGIGIGVDTVVGPVRLTGGWGEQGRFKFYLTLGPTF
jgi:outer membrane protein assembly factor BamA